MTTWHHVACADAHVNAADHICQLANDGQSTCFAGFLAHLYGDGAPLLVALHYGELYRRARLHLRRQVQARIAARSLLLLLLLLRLAGLVVAGRC